MIIRVLTISFLISFPSIAQTGFVAEVGDNTITPQEFKMRYEMMPVISQSNNTDTTKHELLYTLVAEKLFAKEADALGYDEQKNFTDTYTSLEKMFVRDALFNEEVLKKLEVSEQEISKGLKKVSFELKTNIISSTDSVEIYGVYEVLKAGASFDSLLMLRPEYVNQEEPFSIRYGDIDREYVEDAVYSLIPGSFSVPVKTNDGWFIFYLREMNVIDTKLDDASRKSKVVKILTDKKKAAAGTAFMESLLQDVRVNPDTVLFMQAAEKISEKLKMSDTITGPATEKNLVVMSDKDLADIKNELGADTLNMVFIPFEGKSVSLNEFLNRYHHYDFITQSPDMPHVIANLRKDLHTFIEDEVLTREGYMRGLDKLPEVQRDLKMWKESYLAQLYKNNFYRDINVSDEEVIEYYNTLYNVSQPVTQVNIIEIISGDLSVIDAALTRIENGVDFKDVSAELSETMGKETGFFPVTQRGETGRIASGLNPGDVYGPMKDGEKYIIIKLLEKKEAELNMPDTYEQVKETLRNELRTKKLNNVLADEAVELSGKYPVVINDKVLSSLKATTVQMFGLRNMGFGGRIFAVPYTPPFHEWIDKAENIKRILP